MKIWRMAGLAVLSALLLPLGLILGSVSIPWSELWSENFSTILWQIRFPRTVASYLGGSALAVSGLILQTIFHNPLAEPFVLGISSGALTGSVMLIMLGMLPSFWNILMGSFGGAMLVTLIILMVAHTVMSRQALLLIGLMAGYFLSALINILVVFAPASDVKDYHIWTLGSFARVLPEYLPVYAAAIVVLVGFSFILSKMMNGLMMGPEYAQSIGISIRRYRVILLLISSLLTAVVTAYAGPIGFIGLTAPHIARLIFRTSDHKLLIPGGMLIGGNLLLGCDILARILIPPNDLPVGLITSLFGAPLIGFLLWRDRPR